MVSSRETHRRTSSRGRVVSGTLGISAWHIELQAVDVSLVENHGSRDMRYNVGDEAMNVRFEMTSVKKPIVSTVALEDTGWWLGDQGDFMGLRRGDLFLPGSTMFTGSSTWRSWTKTGTTW